MDPEPGWKTVRYLGGKARGRMARDIAEIVNRERQGRPFWEPFCGGLSVSWRLAAGGPGIVSDLCEPLIALHRAVRDGWDPPDTMDAERHRAAKALPDSDPLKGWAGFACSFGGVYFAGLARPHPTQPDPIGNARRSLLRKVAKLRGCAIERLDFLAIEPRPLDLVIYADPPYAGTEPYRAVPAFDHARFWSRVQGWERCGVPVFVSEYTCPVPHGVLLEKSHALQVAGGVQSGARTERLFRVTS